MELADASRARPDREDLRDMEAATVCAESDGWASPKPPLKSSHPIAYDLKRALNILAWHA